MGLLNSTGLAAGLIGLGALGSGISSLVSNKRYSKTTNRPGANDLSLTGTSFSSPYGSALAGYNPSTGQFSGQIQMDPTMQKTLSQRNSTQLALMNTLYPNAGKALPAIEQYLGKLKSTYEPELLQSGQQLMSGVKQPGTLSNLLYQNNMNTVDDQYSKALAQVAQNNYYGGNANSTLGAALMASLQQQRPRMEQEALTNAVTNYQSLLGNQYNLAKSGLTPYTTLQDMMTNNIANIQGLGNIGAADAFAGNQSYMNPLLSSVQQGQQYNALQNAQQLQNSQAFSNNLFGGLGNLGANLLQNQLMQPYLQSLYGGGTSVPYLTPQSQGLTIPFGQKDFNLEPKALQQLAPLTGGSTGGAASIGNMAPLLTGGVATLGGLGASAASSAPLANMLTSGLASTAPTLTGGVATSALGSLAGGLAPLAIPALGFGLGSLIANMVKKNTIEASNRRFNTANNIVSPFQNFNFENPQYSREQLDNARNTADKEMDYKPGRKYTDELSRNNNYQQKLGTINAAIQSLDFTEWLRKIAPDLAGKVSLYSPDGSRTNDDVLPLYMASKGYGGIDVPTEISKLRQSYSSLQQQSQPQVSQLPGLSQLAPMFMPDLGSTGASPIPMLASLGMNLTEPTNQNPMTLQDLQQFQQNIPPVNLGMPFNLYDYLVKPAQGLGRFSPMQKQGSQKLKGYSVR